MPTIRHMYSPDDQKMREFYALFFNYQITPGQIEEVEK